MKNTALVVFLTFVLSFALAACGGASTGNPVADAPLSDVPQAAEPTSGSTAGDLASQGEAAQSNQEAPKNNWVEEVPREDKQGAVTVVITPINLNEAWTSIDFQAALNTHSVDLSMDLAPLATLTTDTGHTVQATIWDATLGGHHVKGKLSFPAVVDGSTILDGVKKLTLTLVNVDAPERIFVWER